MRSNDPYYILGLAETATVADIKAAYRRLARERHPDRDPDNPWAEDEFKELAQAYALLSDAKARAKFDRGEIDASGAPRPAGAGKPSRSKSAKDRAAPGGKAKATKRAAVKIDGADVKYDVDISFMEAAKGCVKPVSMTNGKRLKVTIPAGTEDGALLHLKSQGMPGIGGGRQGDAHVSIGVAPDKVFERNDKDLRVEVPVSLPEAVLGGKIEAPTIDGPVNVTVPAGSNTGTALRLKGKGLPSGAKGGGPRGDQYVTLKVVLPKHQDRALVDFVTEWSEKHRYAVRSRSGAKPGGE